MENFLFMSRAISKGHPIGHPVFYRTKEKALQMQGLIVYTTRISSLPTTPISAD